MEFLDRTYLGNSVKSWLIALAVALAIYMVLLVLKAVVHRKARAFSAKTETDIDDLVADLIRRVKFFFLFFISLYLGSKVLTLSVKADRLLGRLAIIAFLLQAAIWGSAVFDFWVARTKAKRKEEDAAALTKYSALSFAARLVLWSVVVILALDNLGVNITALVAGLGVGGIAVALAIQNVLGDLFASMTIVIDKPFIIGDFIVVDDLRGTVEHIGLKTTRVRGLGGEQLVFANSDLLKSRLRNYKSMEQRRIAFTVGVTYQTPAAKLEAVPGIIRSVIEVLDNVRFDRSHFASYGDFSLNFETVYYVTSPDYTLYMDIQQAINLAIYKRFAEEGIEFAYPTQTIFLEKSG